MTPCTPWTTNAAVRACCGLPAGTPDETVDAAIDVASWLLFEWSARRYRGCCQTIVRPHCRPGSVRGPAYRPWYDYPAWAGGVGAPLGCCGVSRVRLAGYPVRDIVEVLIDGAVVPPADYRLDANRFLTRLGEGEFWPSTQHLELPAGQVGTWSVEYEFGEDPPPAGVAAANALACQFALACASGTCQLPTSVTKIVRQGLTIDRLNYSNVGAAELRTAVPAVDLFLLAANPHRLRRRGAVSSPDVQRYPERAADVTACLPPPS